MASDRFLRLFFDEARDLLQSLETGLMELEARRDDRSHVDATFRAAHTLKGAAGMVGLAEIGAFTHEVEAILDRIRSGTLAVTSTVIGPLLRACDHLREAVEAQAAGANLPPPPDLVEQLASIRRETGAPVVDPLPDLGFTESPFSADPGRVIDPGGTYRIKFTPRSDLLRSGFNPLGILDELRELGTVRATADLSKIPPLDELDPLDCYLSWVVELQTRHDRTVLDEVFLFLGDRDQVTIEAAPSRPIDHQEVDESRASLQVTSSPEAPSVGSRSRSAGSSRVRVDSVLLDELVGMAGELAVLTDSLQGLAEVEGTSPWAPRLEALERIGRRLRDATLELRMVPIEDLFIRFPRVVRDLADHTGKRITLRLEGEETRLDRTIVERLAEPMIHLVRNAIDHGLESPEDREAAGKPPIGRIRISAGHEGDRVAIRLEDDGRGLNRPQIIRRAVDRGLLPPDIDPEDPRVSNVIFEAGFSTREEAGELSGRGVGLDVVRDAIRSLRGTVSLQTVEGKGTTFIIRIPLTLAMIDGLLIEVTGSRFVVPMSQVEECVSLSGTELITTMGQRSAIVRGTLIPALTIGQVEANHSGRQEMLIVRQAEQRVGVAVDRLIGRVQAVIQPLDEGLDTLTRYSGATILADGSICLILDLPSLVSEFRTHGTARLMSPVDIKEHAHPESPRSPS